MTKHLMIDLETLDCTPYSAILQIGAVVFDPYASGVGDDDPRLNLYLNEIKGSTSMDTLAWWLGQDKGATTRLVNGLKNGAVDLKTAMERLRGFAKEHGVSGVWSHGATFDIPIVRTNAGRVGVEMPWKYWNEYDTRTLYMLKGQPTLKREGTHHCGLDDAIHQARCVQEVMRRGAGVV